MFEYYNAMDRFYGKLATNEHNYKGPDHPVQTSNLTPQEIGVSTNPMEHPVSSFAARIREGASTIEIGFMGKGKSNTQQPSPEMFGKRDREDLRMMANINKINTSVHAALHGESLAGFGDRGFDDQLRKKALKEIERAIQFSAEATRGGAIVFHTGEWFRPLSEIPNGGKNPMFKSYDEEDQRAVKIIVADDRTGEITAIRKDHRVFEPKFYTIEDYDKKFGTKLTGTKDENGNIREAKDWIDINKNAIKAEWILDESKVHKVFDRLPVFNTEESRFEAEDVSFKNFEDMAKDLASKGKNITAEELFYKTKLANSVSRARGQALMYGREYGEALEQREAIHKAYDFYSKLDETLPEDEKFKLMTQVGKDNGIIPPKNVKIPNYLKDQMKAVDERIKFIQESSGQADAQAREALEQMKHIKSVEEVGLKKTADTIAQAGMMAMEYSRKHKDELAKDIFVAPENYAIENYGSHPDEMRKIITESRGAMAKMLENQGMDKEEAVKKAENHIKATVDIGHFNMWRQHFQGEKGESREDRDKRFNKWVLKEMDKLAGEGLIGHLHLADNLGFDDEHLTPGQGNAPIKEFVQIMEKHGIKEFIVEQSGFNVKTTMPETWAYLGNPVYGIGGGPTLSFSRFRDQHLGYHSPSAYIVGAYAPSNEWRLWSETPFE